jgi:VIT1/CCC1 family predicted Fe2+/Mn2+ transporter
MKTSKYNWLPDFVYGSIDGVVTTFAVVSGVKGADLSVSIVLILGFANLLGDGFSMAVGKYLSDKANLDHMKSKGKVMDDEINPTKGGWYTFVSFNLVGLVPLIGYIVGPLLGLNVDETFILTCIATLLSLFGIGVIKGYVVSTSKLYAGFQTMLIGGLAAVIAYYVGYFVEKLV